MQGHRGRLTDTSDNTIKRNSLSGKQLPGAGAIPFIQPAQIGEALPAFLQVRRG
jgi:hypothetical protein